MRLSTPSTILLLAIGAALLLPSQARAISISLTSLTNASAIGTNSGNNNRSAATSPSITSSGGTAGNVISAAVNGGARMAWNVTADSDTTGVDTISLNVNYSVTVNVDGQGPGVVYDLKINTSQNGGWTYLNDQSANGGAATLSLGAVTGKLNGVNNANLTLAAGPTLPFDVAGNQQSNNGTWGGASTLTIPGLTGANSFVLNFTWTASASSPSGNGDEGSLRYGLDSTLSGVNADNYPGVTGIATILSGVRNQAQDGHFVTATATVVAVPEPSALVLGMLGLVGMGFGVRRRYLARVAG